MSLSVSPLHVFRSTTLSYCLTDESLKLADCDGYIYIAKATSENLPIGSDVPGTSFEIADKIKSKEVTPKAAIASIKRRLNHQNPNVQILALNVISLGYH
jgi:hypothetical protein